MSIKMTFGENHCILHITRSNSDCLGGEGSVLIFSACCVLHFAHSQLAFDRKMYFSSIFNDFEGQTDIGLNDGFWVPVQRKALGEFVWNLTITACIGHKRKNFKEKPDQQAFLMILSG